VSKLERISRTWEYNKNLQIYYNIAEDQGRGGKPQFRYEMTAFIRSYTYIHAVAVVLVYRYTKRTTRCIMTSRARGLLSDRKPDHALRTRNGNGRFSGKRTNRKRPIGGQFTDTRVYYDDIIVYTRPTSLL